MAQAILSVANDRAFIGGIRAVFKDAMITAGLVQTTDTGQEIVGANSWYTVWRFDDALQATSPIFLKVFVGYGTTGSTLGVGLNTISVGTGSDGAGNLTGATSFTSTFPNAAQETFSSEGLVKGEPGGFLLKWGGTPATTGTQSLICIDRSRDASGLPTADGFFAAVAVGGNTSVSEPRYVVYKNGTVRLAEVALSAPFPYQASYNSLSTVSLATPDGNAPAFPIIIAAPDISAWVLPHAVLMAPGDMSVLTQVGTKTYRGIDRNALRGSVGGRLWAVGASVGASGAVWFQPSVKWEA